MKVRNIVERREKSQVVRWMGREDWPIAHEIAALFPKSTGFSVCGDSLIVQTGSGDSLTGSGGAEHISIVRGAVLEVRRGHPDGPFQFVRFIAPAEFNTKWQFED